MKRLFTLLSLTFISYFASAQDIGVVSIDTPVSGCSLSNNETVTVQITNFGSVALNGVPFTVTYLVNLVPHTEPCSFAVFPVNATLPFTFTTGANLSAPGVYAFDAHTNYGPDGNSLNDSPGSENITCTAPSVGGSIAPAAVTVCSGSNAGTLTLSGITGTVVDWESSTDNGVTWSPISNTTLTQNYSNLTQTTWYRAAVQNSPCASTTSAVSVITVDPATVGGIVSPAATTVCSGANAGTLTLSGHTGNIVRWAKSTDGGVTWVSIANVTTTQNYLNVAVNTLYHAVLKSGVCSVDSSADASLTVTPPSVGGTIAPALQTVCSGSNAGNLTLSGQTGTILSWEYSVDGGTTWLPISNTTNSQNFSNISVLTLYHVIVRSGVCANATSATATILVTPPSVGGTTSSNATVCTGVNNGTTTLAGQTGSVLSWEFSTDGGVTWTGIGNTTTSNTFTNIITTTMYHAVVQNGSCAAAISSAVTITVNPLSVGGTVSSSATVCAGANAGTLTLAGQTGSVIRWEFSIDGGLTWTSISNTTTTQTYTNLVITTRYRAVVQSGVCSTANSVPAIITVTPATVGGNVTANATVCSGANAGTLTLAGQVGSILSWEFSTDGGVTWTAIGNTTTTQTYTNIVITTMYRAEIRSGGCATVASSAATITVTPPSVGGTTSSNAVVCSGINAGTITLAGQTGSIVRWEYSVDGGVTWINISNTTTSNNYSNLTVTTKYRAVVQSGTCAQVTSSITTITVTTSSVGGTVTSNTSVCSGSNNGTLSLGGQTGNVLSWQFSTDGGVTWNPIVNTTTANTFTNLIQTTMYRAVVQSGSCGTAISAPATVSVSPVSVGGVLVSNATVCAGSNAGTLTVAGVVGNIIRWEYSIDGGITWLMISNTSTTQSYLNLTQTTMYHAVVQSGVCNPANSNNVTITVSPMSVGGTVSSSATVCASGNLGTLNLTGQTGNVLNWLSSIDNGVTWISIVNNTTSLVYNNLAQTTWFEAVVQSGGCSNDTSSYAAITVDPVAVGGAVNTSTVVCSGSNNGVLTLTGQTGTIQQWEYSTDGGFTWLPISNTTTILTYNNLSTTTMYHVLITSGSCPSATSAAATITVTPATVAGMINNANGICAGANNGILTLTGYTGSVLNWLVSTDNGVTWVPNGNTDDTLNYVNVMDTIMYEVIVQSGGCNADTTNAMTLIVYPKPVAAFTVADVCYGAASVFVNTSSITGNSTIQTYFWDFSDNSSSGSQNPNHTFATVANYAVTLIVTSDHGCRDTLIDTARVHPNPLVFITSNPGLVFCQNDSIQLSTQTNINYTYVWSTGATTSSIYVDTTGGFTVTVTDTSSGCLSSSNVNTLMNFLPTIVASNDTTIKLGTSITLNASGGVSYSWIPFIFDDPLIATPTATPAVTTIFTVYVTSSAGCVSSDQVIVTVDDADPVLVISNVMTTNGDGYNDDFYIDHIVYFPANEVSIYNRNGQQVYTTTGYQNNWDGTYNGKPLPDGTYYYVVKLTDLNKVFKGSVTILNSK